MKKCPNCDGRGKTECPGCEGDLAVCPYRGCDRGWIFCWPCDGTGEIQED